MAAAVPLLALEALIAEEVLTNLVFQLVGQVVSAALAPEMLEIQQLSFKLTNTRALDPPAAVEAYIKGHRSAAQARDDVGAAGYSGELFEVLAATAGEPLPLDVLTEAWRRGFVPQAGSGAESVSLEQGIRESRLKNKWIPIVERLQFQLPSPGVVIEAWLRAQIDEAGARDYLYKAGIDEKTATLMYKSAGRPPSPDQLLELYHRGLIPKDGLGGDTLSLEQGYFETDLKNKWWPLFVHLGEYLPPPRTVTALVRAGALNDAQAADLYKKQGLSQELAAVYVAAAHHERVAADKDLAKADLLNLYGAREISSEQARAGLELLHYSAQNIDFLLGYADFKQVRVLVEQSLSRLRALYVGHKIDKSTAASAIDSLGLDPKARDQLLGYWDVTAAATPALLTAVQLATAAAKGWIPVAAAYDELQGRGYDPRDAYLVLLEHKADVSGLAKPAGIIGS